MMRHGSDNAGIANICFSPIRPSALGTRQRRVVPRFGGSVICPHGSKVMSRAPYHAWAPELLGKRTASATASPWRRPRGAGARVTLYHGHREPSGSDDPYGPLKHQWESCRDGSDGLAMVGGDHGWDAISMLRLLTFLMFLFELEVTTVALRPSTSNIRS